MTIASKLGLAAAFALTTSAALAQNTIVDIAAGDDRFETLVAAVTAADLVETLSGEGPFTVFAPTDDAFAALPAGTVEGLLEPDAKGDLTNVLLYHVVAGKVMSGDIAMGNTKVGTALEGANVCVIKGEGVMLDDGSGTMANVIIADIEASNGVIHVIDTVILPGNDPSCM
ncbi:fasciclin domain-containing protein [Maritimibacter fusiformis]|uniref:Fasciclin domain-containing protein n=1 Tax=Maritimibacter fusiformis TaxID=2603819 RepID=A0A5D0RPM6_9RHOB|nr:fasciclin domain-containing protein [Maritimibacter fusiformis]TYB83049.1 fasciclin domain-containing protein [Maritimibacter fusiformis]